MNALKPFTIPLQGLNVGLHEFDFQVDRDFFAAFPESPIQEGDFAVKLFFDKRHEMLVLDFEYNGTARCECDRCLVEIDLPIEGTQQLVVKYSEEEKEEEDDLIFIPWESHELNVARFVYEYIILSLPIIKVYDCEEDENPPCDFGMLDYLDREDTDSEASSEDPAPGNPVWEDLKKKFNTDNN